MAADIISPKSKIVDVDASTLYIEWDSDNISAQKSYELQYRLHTTSTWSTCGVTTSTSNKVSVMTIYNLVGVDFYELYYRVIIRYDGTNGYGPITGSETTPTYSLIFRHGIKNTLKLYDGIGTLEYPIYDTVSINNSNKAKVDVMNISINATGTNKKLLPIVTDNNTMKSNLKVSLNDAGTTVKYPANSYGSFTTPAEYGNTYINQKITYYSDTYAYSKLNNYANYTLYGNLSKYSYSDTYSGNKSIYTYDVLLYKNTYTTTNDYVSGVNIQSTTGSFTGFGGWYYWYGYFADASYVEVTYYKYYATYANKEGITIDSWSYGMDKEWRNSYGNTSGIKVDSTTYSYGRLVTYTNGYNNEPVYHLYTYKDTTYSYKYNKLPIIKYKTYETGNYYNFLYSYQRSDVYYYYTLDQYTASKYKSIDGVISYYYNKYAGIIKNGSYYQGYYVKVNDNYVYTYNKNYTEYGYVYTKRNASTTRYDIGSINNKIYGYSAYYDYYYTTSLVRTEQNKSYGYTSYYSYQYNIPNITYYSYASGVSYTSFSGTFFAGDQVTAGYTVNGFNVSGYLYGYDSGTVYELGWNIKYVNRLVVFSAQYNSTYYYWTNNVSRYSYYTVIPEISSTTSYIGASGNTAESNYTYYYKSSSDPSHQTYTGYIAYDYYINSYSYATYRSGYSTNYRYYNYYS